MKKILMLSLLICAFCAGCGNKENTEPNKTDNDSVSVVSPIISEIDIENKIPNGTYSVSFSNEDFSIVDTEAYLTLQLFDYDKYDTEDVFSLKIGDTIKILNDDVVIEKLDYISDDTNDKKWININGGLEENGYVLYDEIEYYRTLTFNDYPLYYSVGEIKLPVSRSFEFLDHYDLSTAPNGVISYYEDLPNSLCIHPGSIYNELNTKVAINDGEITKLERIWIP